MQRMTNAPTADPARRSFTRKCSDAWLIIVDLYINTDFWKEKSQREGDKDRDRDRDRDRDKDYDKDYDRDKDKDKDKGKKL